MVDALYSGSSGGHYSHIPSFHSGVQISTGEFNVRGNSAMD